MLMCTIVCMQLQLQAAMCVHVQVNRAIKQDLRSGYDAYDLSVMLLMLKL